MSSAVLREFVSMVVVGVYIHINQNLPGAALGRLWGVSRHLWTSLGCLWGVLGRLWSVFGASLASLGTSSSVFGRLGASRVGVLFHVGPFWGSLGGSRGPFWVPAGRALASQATSWAPFGHHFRETMTKACAVFAFFSRLTFSSDFSLILD